MSIYGPYEETLEAILSDVEERIRRLNQQEIDNHRQNYMNT